MLQGEDCAVTTHGPGPQRARRQDDNVVEELLGQIPMLGGSSATDISGCEQGRHEHPWIVEHMFAGQRIYRGRDIIALANPSPPPLFRPSREGLGRLRTIGMKHAHCIIDADDVTRVADDGSKLPAAFRDQDGILHISKFIKIAKFDICNILCGGLTQLYFKRNNSFF